MFFFYWFLAALRRFLRSVAAALYRALGELSSRSSWSMSGWITGRSIDKQRVFNGFTLSRYDRTRFIVSSALGSFGLFGIPATGGWYPSFAKLVQAYCLCVTKLGITGMDDNSASCRHNFFNAYTCKLAERFFGGNKIASSDQYETHWEGSWMGLLEAWASWTKMQLDLEIFI